MTHNLPSLSAHQLSPRERDVVDLRMQGLQVKEIANRLGISNSTTKTHLARVFSKVGCANSLELLIKMQGRQLAGN